MLEVGLVKKLESDQERFWLLARVYWNCPDRELLAELGQKLALFDSSDPEAREGISLVRESLKRDAVVDDLKVDYTHVLLGTTPADPFPYESVYTSKDRLLMQEARDQVVAAYREAGFVIPLEGSEPEDHLAIELAFVAYLCRRAIESISGGPEGSTERYTKEIETFWEKHLRNWVPSFCRDVERRAQTGFYKGIAKITAAHLGVSVVTKSRPVRRV